VIAELYTISGGTKAFASAFTRNRLDSAAGLATGERDGALRSSRREPFRLGKWLRRAMKEFGHEH